MCSRCTCAFPSYCYSMCVLSLHSSCNVLLSTLHTTLKTRQTRQSPFENLQLSYCRAYQVKIQKIGLKTFFVSAFNIDFHRSSLKLTGYFRDEAPQEKWAHRVGKLTFYSDRLHDEEFAWWLYSECVLSCLRKGIFVDKEGKRYKC